MGDYESAVDQANKLPHWLHWFLGSSATITGLAIENLTALLAFDAWGLVVMVAIGGLVFSIPSRIIMGLIPWPYAWLSKRLYK